MPPPKDGSLRAKGTTEEIYEQLRALILENKIAPGERVNIDALARDLGVSQTPVREAIRQLEGDKLIVKTPGKGYRTTPLLDLDQLQDLYEFRLLVDVWAARSVAVNRLSNPARMIDEELRRFESSFMDHEDIRRHLVVHDLRFHGIILDALGNKVVEEAYEQTHSHLHTFRLYPSDTDGRITIAEHRRIWAAIDRCDPEGAEAAMRDHLTAAFHRFAQAFDGIHEEPRQPAVHRIYARSSPEEVTQD